MAGWFTKATPLISCGRVMLTERKPSGSLPKTKLVDFPGLNRTPSSKWPALNPNDKCEVKWEFEAPLVRKILLMLQLEEPEPRCRSDKAPNNNINLRSTSNAPKSEMPSSRFSEPQLPAYRNVGRVWR